jgi:hypothetical protein
MRAHLDEVMPSCLLGAAAPFFASTTVIENKFHRSTSCDSSIVNDRLLFVGLDTCSMELRKVKARSTLPGYLQRTICFACCGIGLCHLNDGHTTGWMLNSSQDCDSWPIGLPRLSGTARFCGPAGFVAFWGSETGYSAITSL